uniref:Uncharacterized protein n=1 Tax=Anguilla anguilla TaxID=7936 RepID=A0A0E9PCR3_ANGAN
MSIGIRLNKTKRRTVWMSMYYLFNLMY